jgi:hypothetical protein
MQFNPESIRTVNPAAWPQYPFDEAPRIPESSPIAYSIFAEQDLRVAMRDGVRLALDIFRPWAAGEKFPALISWSPYTRQLQQTLVPIGQNEAGLTEFWVPRGYAHVIVDARGSNDSEGAWDFCGPKEQQDLAEMIEWVASRPWCNGNVGMMGCSYFGRSQLLGAVHQSPSLKAIFPYDASTDMYRDNLYRGGIPTVGFPLLWFSDLAFLNFWGGRLKDPSGFHHHFQIVLGRKYPFDCEYYQERCTWTKLDRIKIPAYFGCDWHFYNLHLPGLFEGWEGTANIPKKMLAGPTPVPRRPHAVYHFEALRWYDHWLKGLDTRVMEGPPIQIYIQGENHWRSEQEWPLARTEWQELFLGGPAGALRDTGIGCGTILCVRPSKPGGAFRPAPAGVPHPAPASGSGDHRSPLPDPDRRIECHGHGLDRCLRRRRTRWQNHNPDKGMAESLPPRSGFAEEPEGTTLASSQPIPSPETGPAGGVSDRNRSHLQSLQERSPHSFGNCQLRQYPGQFFLV